MRKNKIKAILEDRLTDTIKTVNRKKGQVGSAPYLKDIIIEENSDKNLGGEKAMPSFHMSAIEHKEEPVGRASLNNSNDGKRRRSTSFKRTANKFDNDDNKSYMSSNSQLKYQGHKSLLEEALKKETAKKKKKISTRKMKPEDRTASQINVLPDNMHLMGQKEAEKLNITSNEIDRNSFDKKAQDVNPDEDSITDSQANNLGKYNTKNKMQPNDQSSKYKTKSGKQISKNEYQSLTD